MGLIASSCAFSVPVTSHFAALNICQTWNILNARLIPHAWGVRHPLICPLFFSLSFSKALTAVLCRQSTLEKLFLPQFWQQWCMMRCNLVLIRNRVSPVVLCIPPSHWLQQEHCGGWMRGRGQYKTYIFGQHNEVCPKENTALNFTTLLFWWNTEHLAIIPSQLYPCQKSE